MQVVCEATQNASTQVVVGAFECLVRIMQLYYDKMGFYMEQALFGVSPPPALTLLATRTDELPSLLAAHRPRHAKH